MAMNGETRLLPILGDPVRQVRAPLVWNGLFQVNGVNAACLPVHVAPADLAGLVTAMRGIRNLIGLIVTVPHKPAASVLAARLLPRAARVGAVNVLRPEEDGSWTGDMLDGEGFVRGLRRAGQPPEGRRALILGAGGVGAAIASSLAGAGVAAIGIADQDPARAAALARKLEGAGIETGVVDPAARGFDLLVNATPLGLHAEDPLPFDTAQLVPGTIVGDVVMGHTASRLVTLAQEAGCFAQAGTVLMEEQLPAMAEFFGLPSGEYGPQAVARVTGA
ncbi:shikimate dehydrogenase family protein [Roseomonas populi]|uniref:ThiF family adenylyltransferase n=1 Tax=Roseomonas populi TaxID=3121582 RepID=A0ABT1XBU6_9PROT|nr:ThiF family adenylyltransferase [Roseomonas pecuniae]MCR0985600.1 ThiF family adenylyltransferase [Roseomonas pecuniae]